MKECLIIFFTNFFTNIIPYLFDQVILLLKSWPFVILLICLILRKQIKTLFERIKEFETVGTKIVVQQEKPNEQGLEKTDLPFYTKKTDINNENILEKKAKLPDIPEGVFKKIWNEQENNIKRELKKIPFDDKDILIRDLSSCQIALEFERIFIGIFKSQIDALQRINGCPNGIDRNEININYYLTAKKTFFSAYFNFSFENWLNYLNINRFIEEKDNKLVITERGKCFLQYIIVQMKYDIKLKQL